MAIETELKLCVTPEQLERIRRHAILKDYRIAKPVSRRLHNIYFDTPELELHQRKMALRLRRVGGQWLQTLKGGGSVKAGLHQRDEFEVPVARAHLNFSVLSGEQLPAELREKLAPVFTTDFYRTTRMLDWQGAQIEVCMDHGEIKTLQRSTPICEVELELKSGEPRQLFELAEALLDIVPFELETVSKAEKGFRLLAGFVSQTVKFELPELLKTGGLTDALQSLIWACLLHFQENLRGVHCENHDAEYVHQMRVALRRLRVVLRMCEKLHTDEELALLRDAAAKLGITLGRIREWDVFIVQIILPMSSSIEENHGQALLAYCEQQRAACYASLVPRELQHFILRFAIWMNGGYWQVAESVAPSLPDFSNRYLQRLSKRYKRAAEQLDNARQLHALRIVVKKLRYSVEFFSMLYDKHKVKFYLSALGEVQELLGFINDISVAQRLLDDMNKHLPQHNEVIVFLKDKLDAELPIKLTMLHKALHSLGEQQPFWKT